jgi:endopeptidase Clp ATP-binding regulatory subunit ClpX
MILHSMENRTDRKPNRMRGNDGGDGRKGLKASRQMHGNVGLNPPKLLFYILIIVLSAVLSTLSKRHNGPDHLPIWTFLQENTALISDPVVWQGSSHHQTGRWRHVLAFVDRYDYSQLIMSDHSEKIPDPKEIEKEISDFLAKKFKNNVKIVSPVVLPQELSLDNPEKKPPKSKKIHFDLLPEDLVAYLDQYIVKQDRAKEILATKICTHFNRINYAENSPDETQEMVGSIKNNVLMLGPTGVGKTYIIKLIANKIGVPFIKGDATKFSETGYVGGDVEDLVRDLVREADDDIRLAEHGIIYIDEIDKIAGSRHIVGADVSRAGVQRALLKPMEETEIDLKVAHDPISMIQEIERFRKTGKREKRTVNTKNILFIMSGAFTDLSEIIRKRLNEQGIGFGANITGAANGTDVIQHVQSEDLIGFGFESEFVGRMPVRAIFQHLTEDDLFQILKNPNNPIILGKKLDFASYGIQIKFSDDALRILAKSAFEENTGARGLVSAVENALLVFERKLPSTGIDTFSITSDVIQNPDQALKQLLEHPSSAELEAVFKALATQEHEFIKQYLRKNATHLAEKHNLTMTPARIDIVAAYYTKHNKDIKNAVRSIKSYYDDVKKIELYFFKNHDINIVLEEDAIDHIIEQVVTVGVHFDALYHRLKDDFRHGLSLVREKTGQNRFFITRRALKQPDVYIANLLKKPAMHPKA